MFHLSCWINKIERLYLRNLTDSIISKALIDDVTSKDAYDYIG